MEIALPQEIQVKRLPQLPPSTSCNSMVSVPVNGSSFTQNQQIILDLNTGRGFLNPNSLYMRYTLTATKGVADTGGILAIPVYTPFSQFQLLFNSQVVENIADYNILCCDLVNTKTNFAQKSGLAPALGIGDSTTTLTSANCNGRVYGAATSVVSSMSAPVPCLLSMSESYVPMFLFGAVRMILTLDTVANMFATVANGVTAYTITNFELCYDIINFDPSVEAYYQSLVNQNGKIVVKSSSWMTGSQPLTTSSTGSQQLPYNYRLASVKSVLLHCSPVVNTSVDSNGKFDAVDITSSNGQYQFEVGGVLYPPRPLDTVNNKNGIISELALALFGNRNILSADLGINNANWNITSSGYGATGNVGIIRPATFLVGVNLERIPTSSAMLTGVSTLLSPINCRLNINTAPGQATQLRLFAYYDALMEIDPMTRDVKILQ